MEQRTRDVAEPSVSSAALEHGEHTLTELTEFDRVLFTKETDGHTCKIQVMRPCKNSSGVRSVLNKSGNTEKVSYVAGWPQAFWDVPTSKTMELRTGPIEENKASTMGLRLFDFLSNRTARSTRMARIALMVSQLQRTQ